MSNISEYKPVPLPKQKVTLRRYVHLTSKGDVTRIVFNKAESAEASARSVAAEAENAGASYLGRLIR